MTSIQRARRSVRSVTIRRDVSDPRGSGTTRVRALGRGVAHVPPPSLLSRCRSVGGVASGERRRTMLRCKSPRVYQMTAPALRAACSRAKDRDPAGPCESGERSSEAVFPHPFPLFRGARPISCSGANRLRTC